MAKTMNQNYRYVMFKKSPPQKKMILVLDYKYVSVRKLEQNT